MPRFRYCLNILLIFLFAVCLIGTCRTLPARADEFDWAIPSGPLPDVPEPSDPVVVDGDDESDSSSSQENESNSNDNQSNTYNDDQNQQPAEQAQSDNQQQQPTNVIKDPAEAARKAFQIPAALLDTNISANATGSPVAASYDNLGEGPAPAGISDSEWHEAANCQKELDALYDKWPLSNEEVLKINKLQETCDAFWQKAVSQPGLSQAERDKLRLKLHTLKNTYTKVSTVSKKTIDGWINPPPLPVSNSQNKSKEPTINPVTSWLVSQFAVGQAQSAVEFDGQLKMDQFREENCYGDVLGIGKIAIAYKNGGVSSAIAESANFLIGRIKAPMISMAAGLGVEGGRQYSNVAFQAENKFMTDAMKAVGGDFDQKQFWSDFKKDSSVLQKAVMEWIGYGNE